MNEESSEPPVVQGDSQLPQKYNSANRPAMLRGGMRPGTIQPGGGNPLSQDEERLWDKKEDERRAQIKNRYTEVIDEIAESKDTILEIVNKANIVFKGRDNRIDITYEQVEDIFDCMRALNASLGKARSLFDAYVHFSRSTPDLTPVNNILFNFNRFLVESQQRPFFILWSNNKDYSDDKDNPKDDPKYYFRAVKIKNYANKLSFLLERILGALEIAGNYIVDIPKTHPQMQQRYDGSGGSQLGGMGGLNRFDNRFPGSRFSNTPGNQTSNPYLRNLYDKNVKRNAQTDPVLEEIRRLKTVEKSSPRDFGDEQDEYEGA